MQALDSLIYHARQAAAGQGTASPAMTEVARQMQICNALFTTLPYGKFAHSVYRTASLLRYAVEKRQPSSLALGND